MRFKRYRPGEFSLPKLDAATRVKPIRIQGSEETVVTTAIARGISTAGRRGGALTIEYVQSRSRGLVTERRSRMARNARRRWDETTLRHRVS